MMELPWRDYVYQICKLEDVLWIVYIVVGLFKYLYVILFILCNNEAYKFKMVLEKMLNFNLSRIRTKIVLKWYSNQFYNVCATV
jgi:hypothetical protein